MLVPLSMPPAPLIDMLAAVGGVETTLAGLGYSLKKGAGLAAAQEVFG